MRRGRPGSVLLALAAIVVLAVVLRARGLAYGLPAVYNPDEVAIMSRALGFAKGDLNPHNFLYPSLYFYVLFGWIGASFAVGWVAGVFESVATFQQSFFVDPTAIYLAGRSLSVVCGALSVVATWRLGEGLADRATGLAAALFLAVAPFAVRDAHYVKHDVPATLALLVAMLAIVRAMGLGPSTDDVWGRRRSPRPPTHPALNRDLLLAGFACGLAVSVHYYLVFVAVPLVVAAWWRTASEATAARVREVTLAVGAAAVGFFAGSPFLLAEPMTALGDIAANRRIVMDRAVDASGGLFPSAGAYAQMLASDAMGWPAALLALVGLAVFARRQPRRTLLLASFPIAFLAFIGNTVAATRYLNPVLPFVAIVAGVGATWLASRLAEFGMRRHKGTDQGRSGGSPATAVLVAMALLAAWPALSDSITIGSFFRQSDTRTLARAFIEAQVPAGASVLVQPYSVPLVQSREGLVEALRAHLGDETRASIKFRLQLGVPAWPAPAYRLIYLGTGGLDVDKIYVDPAEVARRGLDVLRGLGVQYVVLKGYNGGSPAAQPLAAALAREARRVAVFTPYRPSPVSDRQPAAEPFLHNSDARIDSSLERPGPVIELWKL